MLVFRWHNKCQDGFTNLKDGARPGQPKTGVTNAYIADVTGLIQQDARLTVKNIAHYAGRSSQQLKFRKVCARCAPIA